MFSWICPKCGHDVPPAYTECPNCNPAKRDPVPVSVPAGSQAPVPPPPPPPLAYSQPQVAYAPPPPAPSPYAAPARPAEAAPREHAAKPWLVMVFAAIGIVGLLALLYLYVLPRAKSNGTGTPQTAASADQPAQAASTPAPVTRSVHPYAKFLEVAGLRVNEDKNQRVQVQFIVVNHSAADLPEMKMHVTVRSGSKSVFDFPYTVASLGPFETKEATATLKTDLKPYEMPDWQFLKADFDITSSPEQ